MRFKGVLFDAGDILYDATPWRRWLAVELSRRGQRTSYPELVDRWEALLVDVYTGRANYWERFDQLATEAGVPATELDELRAAARDKGKAVQAERQPSPGAPAALRALRSEGFRLGVLSDTEASADRVREGLDQLGFDGLFDAVVTSRDLGHAKPEPEAFKAAAESIGLALAECAFVAHDVDELEGAQAVGLYAIGYHPHPNAPTDVTIASFEELTDILLST